MTATMSRKIDAAIVEETPAQAYIQAHEESLTYRLLEDDQAVFAIAFPKDSPLVEEFNKALEHLESIGELDELKQICDIKNTYGKFFKFSRKIFYREDFFLKQLVNELPI